MAPRKKAATGESAHQPAGERLSSYERKRDFGQTPEPSGRGRRAEQPARKQDAKKSATPDGPRFVVQRHRARRLHYDLRFEIDGVLASWAVPKGPTLDPDVKHAAIHVEDHPIEYENFEGVIPSGQYGGGDVIVWDTGTWDLHAADDAAEAVRDGELHADIYGEKLKGRFILIRRQGRGEPGKEQWLLFHKHDEYAVKGWDPEDYPKSVLSGRTNDEVKADPDRMWRSDLPPSQASVPADSAAKTKAAACAAASSASPAPSRPRPSPQPSPAPRPTPVPKPRPAPAPDLITARNHGTPTRTPEERARLPRPARTSWPPWTISATAGPGRCSGAG